MFLIPLSFDFNKWITFSFAKKFKVTFHQITSFENKNSNNTLDILIFILN
jgi:hypothetical protein